MISLIACVTNVDNKLCIGKDNNLLFQLKDDMKFFKNITSDSLNSNSKLNNNIVIMGSKTYNSIPNIYRPLKNRFNFVITNNKLLINSTRKKLNKFRDDINEPYFMTIKTFIKIYIKYNPNVFVIGGAQIYNYFLSSTFLKPSKLYITEVTGVKINTKRQVGQIRCIYGSPVYTFMDNFDYKYRLVGYSQQYKSEILKYRILYYNYQENFVSEEFKYLDLAKDILINGKERIDRTNVGTISKLSTELRFDISNEVIPLLTTKKVPFKAILEELLFFCRGDTDTKILENRGVKIWNGNTTRKFLDNRGLSHYSEGIMGNMYGWSWRHYNAKYSQAFADTSSCDTNKIGGFDQLNHVEQLLKTDPFSRRIYISNLNPSETQNMCLEMCHTYIQFYVTEENGVKYLSSYFTMRSSDSLAWCYNICSYSILTRILALRCNMKAKEIIYNAVDCHIYKNHVKQIEKQICRNPRPLPKLNLSNELKNKNWSEMKFSDFELIGYFPHPGIKMEMAI
jgi:thymidylate synthase